MSLVETGFYNTDHCDIAAFDLLVSETRTETPASAATVESGVPVYDVPALLPKIEGDQRQSLLQEWASVLLDGAGVLVLKGLAPSNEIIDDVTGVFEDIMAEERQQSIEASDHFAAAGSNVRIWNSHQKLCLKSPGSFVRYHANPALDAICEAWLGPAYQMTAQTNLVRPGGKAQVGHRDYQLGFMSLQQASSYPRQAHALSPGLTLQGAIAHCDMPVESGPTMLLPHSQKFASGYLAMNLESFQQFFEQHSVQLPLQKGDGLFFNPALFHGAGENRSDNIERLANLFQVSSAFGRAMESLDREAMCRAIYPELLSARKELSHREVQACVAASAEGYAFPSNLDSDLPVGGKAPQSQAEMMHQALAESWAAPQFNEALQRQSCRRQP